MDERAQLRLVEPPGEPPVLLVEAGLEDLALIAGVRRGDRRAQAALYARVAPLLERVLVRALGPDRELADLLHAAFVRVLEGLPKLRDFHALTGLAVRVAARTARDELARRRRRAWLRVFELDELEEWVIAPLVDDESRDVLLRVHRLLGVLTPDERVAFALRVIDDLPLAEVADACECSLATVKRRIARAERRFVARASGDALLRRWVRPGAVLGRNDMAALRPLAARIARAQDVAAAELGAREEVAQRLAESPWTPARSRARARRVRNRRVAFIVLAVAALVVLGAVILQRSPEALAFHVGASEGHVGAWIAAHPGESVPLAFSDGSQGVVHLQSAARVQAVDDRGATLVLERGRASLELRDRPRARWTVQAGSYVLSAAGAGLDVAWDPALHALAVGVRRGRVAVRSDDGREVTLGPEDRLVALPGQWTVRTAP